MTNRPRRRSGGATANVSNVDYNMRTIASKAVVSRLSAGSDASVMASLTEMLLMDLRVALQDQVVSGPGTAQTLAALHVQAAGASYGGGAANTEAAASGDAAKGILNGTKGLHQAILKVRERGGDANYILAGSADANKIYSSLQNLRSPFPWDRMFPYGSPMGASVIHTPQLPANTMVVASLGSPMMHVVPIMGSFRINVSYDTRLESDEILLTAVVYAQNVVQNPGAFQVITATNILTAESA